ncbi:Imm49 family immunity protein [Streptomyces uncialis]|uniref:immunity 49 family protein n=1 Tax=Streptomyces uncialis TaxID=1048205 RepID=UPI00378A77D6
MRIERHPVAEASIAEALDDFTNRISRLVISTSKGGPMAASEWLYIGDAYLDHLGALSVADPGLDTPEARAVLNDAAAATVGAVQYAAYCPHLAFHIHLDYVNFGIGYDAGEGIPQSISTQTWIDAFCLAVLTGSAERHGEAFHFARQEPQHGTQGQPSTELIHGLLAYTLGTLEDDDAPYPPTKEHTIAALDTAIARIRTHHETHQGRPDHLHSTALDALRALAGGDRDTFTDGMATLLRRHSAPTRPSTVPGSLLPLLPLALAALAYRREGWWLPHSTDYLPRTLVTGFETAGPRVGPYGATRRPDAVAELGAGPVTVERPGTTEPLDPDHEDALGCDIREELADAGKAWRLGMAMSDLVILVRARALTSDDASDRQIRDVRRASRAGAAFFRAAVAEPGTTVDVTVEGEKIPVAAYTGVDAGPAPWQKAVGLALISGARDDLAPLVLSGTRFLRNDPSAFAAYRLALLAYLHADDPRPAMDAALEAHHRARNWGFLMPPAVLLSQLVDGDEQSFNLALLDALEEHRDYYRVGDRADDPDRALNLDILALTCHARRRGWNTLVAGPYLPPRLLHHTAPLPGDTGPA